MGKSKRKKALHQLKTSLGFGSCKLSARLLSSAETPTDWQKEIIAYFESKGKIGYYPGLVTKNNKTQSIVIHFYTLKSLPGKAKLYAEFLMPADTQVTLSQKEVDYLSPKLCRDLLNHFPIVLVSE